MLGDKKEEKKSYGKLYDKSEVSVDQNAGTVKLVISEFDDDPQNKLELTLSKACAVKNMSDNVAGAWLASTKVK